MLNDVNLAILEAGAADGLSLDNIFNFHLLELSESLELSTATQQVSQQVIPECDYSDFKSKCFVLAGDTIQVFTSRPVYRVYYSEGGQAQVYKMVGVVKSLLCSFSARCVNKHFLTLFEEAVIMHPMQWCIALLDEYSSIESGRVTLMHCNNSVRVVEDSLKDEMKRMGLLMKDFEDCFIHQEELPGVDGLDPRHEKSVGWFIENVGVVFDRHMTPYGHIDFQLGTLNLPGQALNIEVYLTFMAPAFCRALSDITLLWRRSFQIHRAYAKHNNSTNAEWSIWQKI